ncbi:hypothetical protein FQR65_LT20602 [Abscondita terminalis]|nr:hypothetical protein FQR65_LT20602 [Abscondita terminalis]
MWSRTAGEALGTYAIAQGTIRGEKYALPTPVPTQHYSRNRRFCGPCGHRPAAEPERIKLIDVYTWGTAQWSTMKNAFIDCRNLNITATDVPDLSNVADMSRDWNTSNVTNMGGMFQGATLFDQNIGSWNTQNVTDMSIMFNEARAFNQPIGNWNTVKCNDCPRNVNEA